MKTIACIAFLISFLAIVGAITTEQLHPLQVSIFSIVLGILCYPKKDRTKYRTPSQAYRDTNVLQ